MWTNHKRAVYELKKKLTSVNEKLKRGEEILHKASDSCVELRRLKAEYESAIKALNEQ